MLPYAKELATAKRAVLLACKASSLVFQNIKLDEVKPPQIYQKKVIKKQDNSPVTIVDYSTQAIMNYCINSDFPDDPIVAEEDSDELITNNDLTEKVLDLTNRFLPLNKQEMLAAIQLGNKTGKESRFWTVDPIGLICLVFYLDGTKGFLRGGQYAICLALIEKGKVLGCPNLPNGNDKGLLVYATKNQGAFKQSITQDMSPTRINVQSLSSTCDATFCESVESGHSSQSDSLTISKALSITKPPIRMDSQCKYALVAQGEASMDHAAGSLIVEEAGGIVTDTYGKELEFGHGRTLIQNKGIIASNKHLHPLVLNEIKNKIINK